MYQRESPTTINRVVIMQIRASRTARLYHQPGADPQFGMTSDGHAASDAHRLGEVAWRISDLTAMAAAAGYSEVSTFRSRSRMPYPL
jgi:hypothetical protein